MENMDFFSGRLQHQIDTVKSLMSERQTLLVNEYCELSNRETITESEVHRIAKLWEIAETDTSLFRAFTVIDQIPPKYLEKEKLLADNTALRAALSEHVPIRAEEKLRQENNSQEILNEHQSYIPIICPDGTGIVHILIEDDGVVNLSDLLNTTCQKCNHKLIDHKGFKLAAPFSSN